MKGHPNNVVGPTITYEMRVKKNVHFDAYVPNVGDKFCREVSKSNYSPIFCFLWKFLWLWCFYHKMKLSQKKEPYKIKTTIIHKGMGWLWHSTQAKLPSNHQAEISSCWTNIETARWLIVFGRSQITHSTFNLHHFPFQLLKLSQTTVSLKVTLHGWLAFD